MRDVLGEIFNGVVVAFSLIMAGWMAREWWRDVDAVDYGVFWVILAGSFLLCAVVTIGAMR